MRVLSATTTPRGVRAIGPHPPSESASLDPNHRYANSRVTPRMSIDDDLALVFVASYGRSGSSLLMKCLGLHPELCLRRGFPGETRFFQYAYVFNKSAMQEVTFGESLHYAGIDYTPHEVDDEPARKWVSSTRESLASNRPTASAQLFYRTLGNREGVATPAIVVEKAIGHDVYNEIASDYASTRVIFLIRDPRDVFLSVKRYNAKRGFAHFGAERGDEHLLRRIIAYTKGSLMNAQLLSPRATIVSYGSMITQPLLTLRELFRWLGVDYRDGTIRPIVAGMNPIDRAERQHMTADSQLHSVHRWRDEGLDDETKELFSSSSGAINDISTMLKERG